MGGPQVNIMQLLLAGEGDLIMGYDFQALSGVEKGLPVVAVATSFQHDLRCLMARPDVKIAARVSDRGESIERALSIPEADIIWLDEFDRLWCTEADVRRLRDAGRTVHAVSPDLHGGTFQQARRRWLDFIQWGVDGICTDYPAALDSLLRTFQREAA